MIFSFLNKEDFKHLRKKGRCAKISSFLSRKNKTIAKQILFCKTIVEIFLLQILENFEENFVLSVLKKNSKELLTERNFYITRFSEKIKIMNWFEKKRVKIILPYSELTFLAEHGKLYTLEWLRQRNQIKIINSCNIYDGAIMSENIKILDWIKEKGILTNVHKTLLLDFARRQNKKESEARLKANFVSRTMYRDI